MALDADGDDCLPDFSTDRFDVFHKHCTRNAALGTGRDVYLAFHRNADIPRPVCVVTLRRAGQKRCAIIATRLDNLEAENKRLREAIRWALGENGDFRYREEGEGQFWWRKELRERAGLNPAPPTGEEFD